MYSIQDLLRNPNLLDPYIGREMVPLECTGCGGEFERSKRQLRTDTFKKNRAPLKGFYCTRKCKGNLWKAKLAGNCSECKKEINSKRDYRSKSDRRFCNSSCAASYNNKHKTHGTRRSKLEAYLEEQIRLEYPNLEMICNGKAAIGSELDFYFPQLKLAIELNGIFHYEPIYGQDKLEKIQKNDKQKMRRCLEEGIEFCTVDSSSCSYLSKNNKAKYLNIFKRILKPLLGRAV